MNQILLWVMAILGGGFGLYLGGDWLVQGASTVAQRFKVSNYVIGLTVVSLGTSAPEFFISLFAALKGDSGISLGNIVGSNIANIGLVLSGCAILSPMLISRKIFRFEIPLLMILTLFYAYSCIDGIIDRGDGLVMLLSLLLFLGFCLFTRQEFQEVENKVSGSLFKDLLLLAMGLAFLYAGAELFIWGAKGLAVTMGVPDLLIGLTLVALGTSLPELVTSIIAAYKKQVDMVVGNVIGSNLFNIGLIQGMVAVIHPVESKGNQSLLTLDLPFAFFLVVLMGIFLWSGRRLNRIEGCLLLLSYGFYIVATSWMQMASA